MRLGLPLWPRPELATTCAYKSCSCDALLWQAKTIVTYRFGGCGTAKLAHTWASSRGRYGLHVISCLHSRRARTLDGAHHTLRMDCCDESQTMLPSSSSAGRAIMMPSSTAWTKATLKRWRSATVMGSVDYIRLLLVDRRRS